MRYLSLLFLAIFLPSTPHKSATSNTHEQFGTVSGRVFAITENGDLKPARMARVYMFCCTNREDADGSSAALIYGQEANKALEAFNEEREHRTQEQTLSQSEQLECTTELVMYHKGLTTALQRIEDSKKATEVLIGETDEEGYFKFNRVSVGNYLVIASGQAGAYDAFWRDLTLLVKVKAATETITKLSKMEQACLRVN